MEAKLVKIELKPNSLEKAHKLIQVMLEKPEHPQNEMRQKGYFWDSIFLSKENGKDFLYILTKSKDFSKITKGEEGLVATPFREIYDQFKKECWTSQGYIELETLACFDSLLA